MAFSTATSSGAVNWLFQRISGILIGVILVIHLGAVHFGTSPVDLGSPFWKFFDVSFLILLLYHVLSGYWLIIEDYVRTSWIRVSLYGISWILGLAFLILGFVTIVPFGT